MNWCKLARDVKAKKGVKQGLCVMYTGLFKMIVGVLTSCHTQYTSFSRCNPMWFLSMELRQASGLCSSSSRKYPV